MLVACSTGCCWLVKQASTYGQPCRAAMSSPDPAKRSERKTAEAGPEGSVAVHGHGCDGDDDETGIRRERKMERRRFLGFIWIYLDACPIRRAVQGIPRDDTPRDRDQDWGRTLTRFRMWATEARRGATGLSEVRGMRIPAGWRVKFKRQQQHGAIPTRIVDRGQWAVGGRSW